VPAEDFSSLYDISDLISPTTFDSSNFESSFFSTPVEEEVLEPSYPSLLQNGQRNSPQHVMEDVD